MSGWVALWPLAKVNPPQLNIANRLENLLMPMVPKMKKNIYKYIYTYSTVTLLLLFASLFEDCLYREIIENSEQPLLLIELGVLHCSMVFIMINSSSIESSQNVNLNHNRNMDKIKMA